MPLEPEPVTAITFDSFTTIVDVATTTQRALTEHVDDPETIADIAGLWRTRAVEYRMLSNAVGPYEDYLATTEDALRYALAVCGVTLSDEAVADLVSSFHELDVFDDVADSLHRLDDLGYDLYIVSNGTQDLLRSMVARADIEDVIVDTVSADDVEVFKPARAFYRHATETIGIDPEAAVHVATPWYDIYGANNAGMQSVWVNRSEGPWEAFDGGPDETVTSLADLPPLFE